jgi:hypothetical protein
VALAGGKARMNETHAEGSDGGVIEQLRQLWVMSNEETIGSDLRRARLLAGTVPKCEREAAEEFVVALERLERWLRDF